MKFRQPMSPAELKKITEEAKQVSIKKGIVQEEAQAPAQPQGAFASMQNRVQSVPKAQIPDEVRQYFSPSQPTPVQQVNPVLVQSVTESTPSSVRPGMLYSRIYESIETVGQTKEYFNATSSLFTLYALGQLNESVLKTLSSEDVKEIKGILRDFQNTLG